MPSYLTARKLIRANMAADKAPNQTFTLNRVYSAKTASRVKRHVPTLNAICTLKRLRWLCSNVTTSKHWKNASTFAHLKHTKEDLLTRLFVESIFIPKIKSSRFNDWGKVEVGGIALCRCARKRTEQFLDLYDGTFQINKRTSYSFYVELIDKSANPTMGS